MDNGYETLGVLSNDGNLVYSLPDIGVSYFNMNDLVARLTEEDRRIITEFLAAPDEEGIPYSDIFTLKCYDLFVCAIDTVNCLS